MLKNIKELKTTVPSIIATLVLVLALTGTLPVELAEEWEIALNGTCISILGLIGLFSRTNK